MSTEIQQRTPAQEITAQIRGEDFRAQLAAALPEGISVDKFARVTVTALMEDAAKTRDPDKQLVNADRGTLYSSVIKCAQDGLLPDGREAALVVFGGKVSYLPMVQGFRKIVGEHGWTIRSAAVYSNDEFDYTVEPPALTHKEVRPGMERGELVAAYAIARHRDGRREQVVLLSDEIAKRRDVAKTKNVWNEWPAQMWAKTAVRDLFNELPLDPADKERITRVFDTSALEPGEAATLMYGPRELSEASPAVTPAGSGAGEETPVGAADVPDEPDPAGADGQDSDEPGPAPPKVDEAAQALADAAALYKPATQKWPGMSLGEIFNHGDDGREYVKWCLSNARKPEFVKALHDLTRVYWPEAFHEAVAKAEVQS